jgi:predicted nucleic acid-binding protein
VTFSALPSGSSIFVDANPIIYHFAADPVFGPACHPLIAGIENQTFFGYTSPHVIGEVAHGLMNIEAQSLPGWASSKTPKRLRKQPLAIQKLTLFRTAVEKIFQSRLQVLPVQPNLYLKAAEFSQQFGLLTNDALIVAIMQDHGLTHLASNDADFDRVLGITRYAPS